MGEQIRVLARGKVLGREVAVELNHPFAHGGRQQVHLQADKFRVEMDKEEYLVYALAVLAAEHKLKVIKGLA